MIEEGDKTNVTEADEIAGEAALEAVTEANDASAARIAELEDALAAVQQDAL